MANVENHPNIPGYQAMIGISAENELVYIGATRVARMGDEWMDYGRALDLVAQDFRIHGETFVEQLRQIVG